MDAYIENVIEFADMPWETAAPGLRTKHVVRGNQCIRLIEFSDEFTETDWCRKGHIGFVVDGQLEIDINGQVVKFNGGDGLFIPPGESSQHKARVPRGKAILFVVENAGSS